MATIDSAPSALYAVGRADAIINRARPFLNVHRPGDLPNAFVFSLPRSGSTWLMEMIWSQPGFKCCNEPTDLRNPYVRSQLGVADWQSLYGDGASRLLYDYFEGFHSGRLGFLNPRPFSRHYRPYSSRLVFKVIHGCEDRFNWFRDAFNGRIVYLVRHPIAVSLSREAYPTLPALLRGPYRRHFTGRQLSFAEDVLQTGTRLEHGVLSWCLQTAVPLRDASADWVIASYEQLILQPEPIIQRMAAALQLPNPTRMLDLIATPSQSSRKSDGSTRRLLEAEQPTRAHALVEKWRDRVSAEEERRAMEILERFEIDLYRLGESLPVDRIWIAGTGTAGERSGNSHNSGH